LSTIKGGAEKSTPLIAPINKMEEQNQEMGEHKNSSQSHSPIYELANLRLHDIKNPLWAASFFSGQLPDSKAKQKLESSYKTALSIVTSDLSVNKLSGKSSTRESFVGALKNIISSAEGPLLNLSAKGFHHSADKHSLEEVIKNHNNVTDRLELIFSDYSLDNAYNLANSVCEKIAERLYSTGRRIQIHPIFGEDLKRITVNVDDFANFYSIPINNSADSIGTSGHIKVYGDIRGDYVELKIVDNGQGIPNPILRKLRNPSEFGVTYGKKNGSGFGIPMLRQTLKRYGGVLEINSEKGKTEVSMRIPLEELTSQQRKKVLVR
jgi:signal transduction histidine kinase